VPALRRGRRADHGTGPENGDCGLHRDQALCTLALYTVRFQERRICGIFEAPQAGLLALERPLVRVPKALIPALMVGFPQGKGHSSGMLQGNDRKAPMLRYWSHR
jgi:hypothetical protein